MIEFKQVTHCYSGGNIVFENLDLKINEGSIYGVLGCNGVGKTTLLRLMCGLIFPSDGTIDVLGYEPQKRGVEMLQELFFVPDEFTLPKISAVVYGKRYGKFYPNFSMDQYLNLLEELGVDKAMSLSKLSFGQQKTAFIAFAMACNTRLLIMDEPTNGIDIPTKMKLRGLFASISGDDRSIIISTHQVRDLEQLIDSVVVLDGGKLLLNASLYDISKRLEFRHIIPDDQPLYSCETLQGTYGFVATEDGADSSFDLEHLFNAVVSNPEYFTTNF